VYEESLEREIFYHVPILHCRDHEPFIWAQSLDTYIVVEKIPCVPSNKEVYAPIDWGIEYRTYVDTSLWYLGTVDIFRVTNTLSHIGYKVVHEDTMVCSGIQQYKMVYDAMQWVLGTFPSRIPLDRDFKHIIEFGSPKIDEWMDEIHGEAYSLDIYLRLEYHYSRDREQDILRIDLICYFESLVIPLGLTKAPATFQSCRKWHWNLVLFSDATSIFNKTWRVRMS
jgi:hypothetical protein